MTSRQYETQVLVRFALTFGLCRAIVKKMRNRKVSRLVAFITCLSLIAACASDESTNSTISKSEFLAKADAICTRYNDANEEKHSELESNPSEEQQLAFVTDLLPEFINMFGEIRDLGFPAADKALLEGLMDEIDVVLEQFTQDPASMLTAQEPFADINIQMSDYGFTVCGQN